MKITSRVVHLFFIFLLLSIFFSCKTTKSIDKVRQRPASEVINGLSNHQKDYTFFSAKARMKYNGEESRIGGRMNIIAQRDSLIWMNFKKFSVEGARTLIQPDSIWIVYRLDDLYEQGTTQEYLDYYKVSMSFKDLQGLLVGNLPIPTIADLTIFQSDQYYHLGFVYDDNQYKYLLNEDLTLHKASIKDSFERSVIVSFDDYDDQLFAKRKDIEIITPEEGQSKISIKFSNVTFDVPKKIKFDIPTHYRHLP